MFFPGPMELVMVMAMGLGGLGLGGQALPLGMPPTAEDPLLSKVAPDECLWYLTWAGTAEPNAASTNHTEKLLAEPEVRQMISKLQLALTAAMVSQAPGPEEQKVIVEEATKIVKTILTRPGAAFVGKVGLGASGPEVGGGIIVNVGSDEQTKALMTSVSRLETALGDAVKEVEVGGRTWREFPMPEGMPRMLWGFAGHYLILGVGEGSAAGILKRGKTKAPQWLTDVRKKLTVERPSNFMYVNVKAVTTAALAFAPPADAPGPNFKATLTALGLDNVKYYASLTGFDKTAVVTRSLLAIDGEPKGLLALAAGKPLSAKDLSVIPADATFAAAVRADPDKIFHVIRGIIGSIDERMLESIDREVDQQQEVMGINFSEDLFKALGDTWRIYNSPGEGGLIATGLTAVGSVRDADKLAKTLEKFEAFVQAQAKGRIARFAPNRVGERIARHVTIKHFEFNKQKIYFVNFVGEFSPVAPAWCVTDKEFIISLFPSHIKAYLSRGADFKSLASSPKVAQMFSGDGPVLVTYQDTKEMFKLAYPVVQILAQLGASQLQREGIDVDISMLPSATTISKHLTPGVMSVRKTAAGIELTSRQSLPIGGATWLMLPAAVLYGRAGPADFGPAGRAFPAGVEPDFEDAPRFEEKGVDDKGR
ncbi:MAG: hypothetical protein IID44_00335 [Planctomycetes bacterium]|nr:hypothetical protein [Planctomycetota bacterium]